MASRDFSWPSASPNRRSMTSRSGAGRSLQRAGDNLRALACGDFLDRLGSVALEQIAKGRLAVLVDRLVETRRRLRRIAEGDHVRQLQVGRGGQLLLGRVTPELVGQVELSLGHLALTLLDVDRDPDRPGRVRQRPLHRLPNPERGVGRELESPPPVELLCGADQPEHALLNQVGERQSEVLVLASVRDHQPEVGVDHLLLGLQIPALDPLRQVDFLSCGEQRMAGRLAEEQLQRAALGRRGRVRAVTVLDAAAAALALAGGLTLGAHGCTAGPRTCRALAVVPAGTTRGPVGLVLSQ